MNKGNGSGLTASGLVIGVSVKITTLNHVSYQGLIHSYEPINGIAVLQSMYDTNQNKKTSFHIIKLSYIKSIEPYPNSTNAQLLQLEPVTNLDLIQQRENNMTRLLKEREQKIGVDVSVEAQSIFDALSKTLPCRWSGEKIIILDDMMLTPPYLNVLVREGKKVTDSALNRVKKVLEGERSRLGLEKNKK